MSDYLKSTSRPFLKQIPEIEISTKFFNLGGNRIQRKKRDQGSPDSKESPFFFFRRSIYGPNTRNLFRLEEHVLCNFGLNTGGLWNFMFRGFLRSNSNAKLGHSKTAFGPFSENIGIG